MIPRAERPRAFYEPIHHMPRLFFRPYVLHKPTPTMSALPVVSLLLLWSRALICAEV